MWVLLCSRLWLDVMVCGSGTGACRICVAVCDGVSFSSLVHLSPCFCQLSDLKKGVTDEGLRALASAGCGEKLTSLHLECECCCVPVCDLTVCGRGSGRAGYVLLTGALSPLFSSCLLFCKLAVLEARVTDSGLRALASAGCGKELTSLSLGCE